MSFAHSKPGVDRSEWHTLEDHLRGTATKAARFAAKFGSERWGWYAGLWHDLGKYCAAFQAMIGADAEAERTKVNHSSAGALRAMEELPAIGLPLAFAIAGHHAGLADAAKLETRLAERQHLDDANAGGAGAEWLRLHEALELPAGLSADDSRGVEMWIRFLFSALIDADRLDTEHFHDPQKTATRGTETTIAALSAAVDAAIDVVASRARGVGGAVNAVRAAVLRDCRECAAEPQGIFSLTVPTGGGKTLASMSFALRHAAVHGLDRVIVVIPYTSIIEQNAGVLKSILPHGAVLEHHTGFDPGEEKKYWLDAENWDAPIVVTTSVQFFESLFASRPSAVRKLHAIARSVVVFDEVQTLPPPLLHPIVDVMGELARRYGTSLVLCTATQPALQQRPAFPVGLTGVREIVREPRAHFDTLHRVDVQWPADLEVPTEWPDLAARIAAYPRVLGIVHRRDDAQTLCTLLPPGTIHLSAAMCPAHRTRVLDDIRGRLRSGEICRVVATQLVEAGVDVDFPVVFRALGGLDSLAQAAGRCNREGALPRPGRLEIFVAPSEPPPGELQTALAAARIVARRRGGTPELFDPSLYEEYFLQLYQSPRDVKGIQTHREALDYEKTAAAFEMIEDRQQSLVIPLDAAARETIASFERRDGAPRLLRRRLQRYSVGVPRSQFATMRASGAVREAGEGSGVFVLTETFRAMYDDRFGLLPARQLRIDPEALFA